jgi:hypothetical protein
MVVGATPSTPNASVKTLVRWWNTSTRPHHSSTFVRRNLLDRVGPLDERNQISIDHNLWSRYAARTTFFNLTNRTFSRATQRNEHQSDNARAARIAVLDRSGHAPCHPNIEYRATPPADTSNLTPEQKLLETICAQENAAFFVSTHYTSIETVPSVMPVYHLIPEKMDFDLS